MFITTLIDAVVRIAGMVWETWWALVLGFTIAGAVEVFASEERMTDLLGGDGWREVAIGAGFGAASSSCSYSAVGTSKSLFKKGASGVASLGAFLFASTDLVVELGLVMWVLLGWEFVIGEYLGGLIAVVVLALLFKHVVPQRWFDAAREHLYETDDVTCVACNMEIDLADEDTEALETAGGTVYFCCAGCRRTYESRTDVDTAGAVSWRKKLLTADGWDTAAKTAISEWEMLWIDIAVGFVLAGLIGAFVPDAWWAVLFGTQGTFSGVVLNTAIAVGIGVVTFMCSVGNVPFALVLWQAGLPFGGVLAFIYSDLIIPPLVKIYRRYYGTRLAVVLFVSLALAALVAGVVVHYLMGGLGLIPEGATGGTLSGEYTLVLNLLLTPVFLAQVYVAYGPEHIVAVAHSLPERARHAADALAATAREVQEAVWRFVMELSAAVLLVGTAVKQVSAAVWTVARAFRVVGAAVVALLRDLREASHRLR